MLDQLETKLLDMTMVPMPSKVFAILKSFNTLDDALALEALVFSQQKSMRLLSYMF
jgi:hypothetical protein